MDRKYEFTGETMRYNSHTLRRIRRLSDGSLGGWIESEENLSHDGDCFVYDDAKIFGNAVVRDDATVCYRAIVCDDARIYGNARVGDHVIVCECALVCGHAWVYGDAMIGGHTLVQDSAEVGGNTKISGVSRICGDSNIHGK